MQHLDKTLSVSHVEMHCAPDCDDQLEQLVIFELVVPVASKVPAPRQHTEVAKLLVRQASVTSTVPPKILTQLRANNTASSAGWCITATLAAPQSTSRRAAF